MPSEIEGPVQNAFAWDSSSGGPEPTRRPLRSQLRAENRPDAAERASAPNLGLPSRKALYQAVRRGQVPARRLGVRRMRFSRDELDRLLRGEASDGRSE